MGKFQHKIELLAPARDLACGISGVNHGADAVYIGGPQFGARAKAGNSLTDIEKLVLYAHQFKAKVYVALNTIFNDQELELAINLSWQLHHIGVDGLIIQDVGLLESELPPIPLHSSTQMNNRSMEKVSFLEKVGFRQIVLARELHFDEIKKIRAATTVPLEFFVHGALCVSYSGQCYISEVVAGRSANKGECAQFCRHCFTLKDEEGKILKKDRYLLSLKDLNLSAHLKELIEAGISSFKIEGRLKDENYVKNITAYYRLALDQIIEGDSSLQRASSGRCRFDFTPDPARSFNRGRTDYFLTDSQRRVGSIDSPKSTGQKLGRVVQVDKRFFTLDTKEAISNGDGLCCFDSSQNLVGIKVNRVEAEKIYPKDFVGLAKGVLVYRNSDTAFNKLLKRSNNCRKIAIDLVLKESVDGLELLVEDEDEIVSKTTVSVAKKMARQSGTVTFLAEKQLRKSGGSLFSVGNVAVDVPPEYHYPAAVFNDLRRKGFDHHLQTRLQQYQPERYRITRNNIPWTSTELSYLDNISNHKAEAFFHRHGVEKIDRMRLRTVDVKDAALMSTRYCVRAQLKFCPKMHNNLTTIAEPLTLVDKTGEYQLSFDCVRCEMAVKMQTKKKR